VAPCTGASTEAEKDSGPTPWMPARTDSAQRKNEILPFDSAISAAGAPKS
jgi:hypothetical protein